MFELQENAISAEDDAGSIVKLYLESSASASTGLPSGISYSCFFWTEHSADGNISMMYVLSDSVLYSQSGVNTTPDSDTPTWSFTGWQVITAAPDGVTIANNSTNQLMAKDVAIGGDAGDLASARGFFYDSYVPWYPGVGNKPIEDFYSLVMPGRYHIIISRDTKNLPDVRLFWASGTNDGIVDVEAMSSASSVSSAFRLKHRFSVFGSDFKTWSRNQATDGKTWYNWEHLFRTGDVGDGITVNNGIMSVPEYEGATGSEAGISGLVPPAAKGEQNKYLGSDGGWHTVPEGVSLSDAVDSDSGTRPPVPEP